MRVPWNQHPPAKSRLARRQEAMEGLRRRIKLTIAEILLPGEVLP